MAEPSRTQLVWHAMATAELHHKGPRSLTVSDIWGWMKYERTCPTIRKGLHDLAHVGVVERSGHMGNGHQGWKLTAIGRAKFGLSSERKEQAA